MKTYVHEWQYLTILFQNENISDKFVEKIKTHFNFSIFPLRKLCPLWDNVGKYCTVGAGHRWQYDARTLYAGYLRIIFYSSHPTVF